MPSPNIYSRLVTPFGSNLGYVPPPPVSVTVHWTTNTFTSSPCSPSSSSSGGSSASTAGSIDPNSLLGPSGYGPSNFVSGAANARFPYEIEFENSPSATAPAQQVLITSVLDPNLDLSTFQLTEIAFGDTVLVIPPGSQNYQTTVPMTDNGVSFDVVVNASLDYATRLLTVTFRSIDQKTQLPPNILAGFLPPENGTGRGQGFISYVVAPKAGLPTGTKIASVANIIFDSNQPIATDQVSETDPSQGISTAKQALVTIDNSTPVFERHRATGHGNECELQRELVGQRWGGFRHRRVHGVLQHRSQGLEHLRALPDASGQYHQDVDDL